MPHTRRRRTRVARHAPSCASRVSVFAKWAGAATLLLLVLHTSIGLLWTPSEQPQLRHGSRTSVDSGVASGGNDRRPAVMLQPAAPGGARATTGAGVVPTSMRAAGHKAWPTPSRAAPPAAGVPPPAAAAGEHGGEGADDVFPPVPGPVVASPVRDDGITDYRAAVPSLAEPASASRAASRDIDAAQDTGGDGADCSDTRLVPIDANMLKFMQAFPSLEALPARYPIQDKFTVVMINYKRPRHLQWQMKRLSSCPSVHHIYIRVNSGRDSVPADVVQDAADNPKVTMLFPSTNSLNNRFLYPEDMETEFTMSIDDDMEVQPDEIEWAFRVAKQFPAQITGFFPRTIVKRQNGQYDYVIPHLSKKGYKYNVVLTGSGTFFNSRWLHIYSEVMPRKVRDYVNEHFNCEDIAFNMMMSNATGLPPVLVVGSTHTTHSVQENSKAHKGLRTRHGHVSGRSDCIKHLVKIYKRNPLVDSDFMAVPFTYDVPALKQILKSTQVYTKQPTWYPNKPSKP